MEKSCQSRQTQVRSLYKVFWSGSFLPGLNKAVEKSLRGMLTVVEYKSRHNRFLIMLVFDAFTPKLTFTKCSAVA